VLLKAAEAADILPGGMKAVTLNGREIVLCNYEGAFYAVERACGHAKARLERGALTGWILTCPLHYAQFDIRSGEALSGPAPKAPDSKHADPADPSLKTRGLKTWAVALRDGSVFVDLP
jgi:nitrite reductase/ring-hydroxylating ferredoxin subunit